MLVWCHQNGLRYLMCNGNCGSFPLQALKLEMQLDIVSLQPAGSRPLLFKALWAAFTS